MYAIKTTMSITELHNYFVGAGRGEQFSIDGLAAIADHMAELYPDGFELDPVAWCCDFSEYENDEALESYYSHYDAENISELLDIVRDETLVIELPNGGYIVGAF